MIRAVVLIAVALLLAGCVTRVQSIQEDFDSGLDVEQGYLLMAVDSHQRLNEIHIAGPHTFILTSSDLNRGSNYILFKAPAGEYEIKKIDINYFLAFKMKGDSWRFSVKPGVISYVGDLKVRINFWEQSGDFELVNESSEALEFLEENFPDLLSTRMVEYFGPGEDDFFKMAESKFEGAEQ